MVRWVLDRLDGLVTSVQQGSAQHNEESTEQNLPHHTPHHTTPYLHEESTEQDLLLRESHSPGDLI